MLSHHHLDMADVAHPWGTDFRGEAPRADSKGFTSLSLVKAVGTLAKYIPVSLIRAWEVNTNTQHSASLTHTKPNAFYTAMPSDLEFTKTILLLDAQHKSRS